MHTPSGVAAAEEEQVSDFNTDVGAGEVVAPDASGAASRLAAGGTHCRGRMRDVLRVGAAAVELSAPAACEGAAAPPACPVVPLVGADVVLSAGAGGCAASSSNIRLALWPWLLLPLPWLPCTAAALTCAPPFCITSPTAVTLTGGCT